MSTAKHTDGPFRFDGKGWRRDHTNGGEFLPLHGAKGEWLADIRSAKDAHLFKAAPDLLAACQAQHAAIDLLFAMLIGRDDNFFPSKSGQPWEAFEAGNSAIANAEPTQ